MKKQHVVRFMEAIPDAILLIDSDGRIIGSNAAARSLLKFRRGELEKLMVEDLIPQKYRSRHPNLRKKFSQNGDQRPISSMSIEHDKFFPTFRADNTEILTEISLGRINLTMPERQCFLTVMIDRTGVVKEADDLRRKLNFDYLTQLYTRAHYLELSERELTRFKRSEANFSVIYFDVDKFKEINDGYGHSVGDLILRQVGQVCRKTTRSVDIPGRLGGEEFGVTLPEAGMDTALEIANRLRRSISELTTPEEVGQDLRVTASFGVATVQPSDDKFDSVLNRADNALYQSKADGRNKVSVAA